MDRIHYAGHSIVTGTAIAHALLDYAQALAAVTRSATVKVPTLRADGTRGRSELLIGPASQMVSDAEATTGEELLDEILVARLQEATGLLRCSSGSSSTATDAYSGFARELAFDA